jgi:hypothetical protein
MIEVVLNGRLGNWLFQYAAARALALKTGTGVQLNGYRYVRWRDPLARAPLRALRFFNIAAAYSHLDIDAARALERLGLRERKKDHVESASDGDRLEELGAATRLTGYFQRPRCWEGCESELRTDLTPRALPTDSAFLRTAAAVSAGNTISIHVRRGDFVTFERELHGVCTIEYYARAITRMRESVADAKFFVFSDDPGWCRERFKDQDMTVVDVAASSREPALDLYLMSRCSHHVISNSTYSWWGAWLDTSPGAIVCTPDRWFNDEEMSARAMRDTVPARWLRIPCEGQTLAV